jgi:hypothetical protein
MARRRNRRAQHRARTIALEAAGGLADIAPIFTPSDWPVNPFGHDAAALACDWMVVGDEIAIAAESLPGMRAR